MIMIRSLILTSPVILLNHREELRNIHLTSQSMFIHSVKCTLFTASKSNYKLLFYSRCLSEGRRVCSNNLTIVPPSLTSFSTHLTYSILMNHSAETFYFYERQHVCYAFSIIFTKTLTGSCLQWIH